MITRRDVLRSVPLISLAPTVPGFLARSARAAYTQNDGRVLVVIQLDGGNDGINTVVPFDDEGYAKHRRVLRLPTKSLIRIAGGVGLNPALRDAAKLLESRQLAIISGVGYPNPSRSHFQSMAIWHTARFGTDEHAGPGWLGRSFDRKPAPLASGPPLLYVGTGALPAALRGKSATASTLEHIEDLVLDDSTQSISHSQRLREAHAATDDLTAYVRRSTLDAYATADRMAALARNDSQVRYPSTPLADRMSLISRLLKAGFGARVFYTMQSGYDTHAAQLGTHSRLLAELSGALKAFLDDLTTSGLADRVLVLCFSEFGRRVNENGSAGTDHGTAGPVLLAGRSVEPGLIGKIPGLTDLDAVGDPRSTVDFRRIFATVLERWLGLPAREAQNGAFEPLPLLRTGNG